MKRVLALVLALMMVVSCMVFVASAEETDVIVLETGDNLNYYRTNDPVGPDGAPGKIDGVDCQMNTVSGTVAGNGLRFRYQPTKKDAGFFVDATGMNYLCFDLYVSNAAAVKDAQTLMEIASGGEADQSDADKQANLSVFVPDLKDGWNAVTLEIAGLTNNGYNPAHFNYFRMSFVNGFEAGESFTAGIKNLRLTKNVEKVELPDVYTVVADAFVKAQNLTGQAYANAAFIKGSKLETAIDITGYDYFKFDVEVTGAEALKAANLGFNIELTSSGTCDKEEWQVNKALDALVEGGLKEGLNTVVLDLSKAGADLNKTAFNFTRIFNNPFTLAAEATAAYVIKNLRFEKGAPAAEDEAGNLEEYAFTVYDKATEDLYLLRTNAGAAGDKRFSDGALETVYKFTIANVDAVKSVKFKATVWGQLLLQVTADPDAEDSSTVEWTEIYNAGETCLNQGEMEFDLTSAFVDENGTMPSVIYIRFADSVNTDGCGGSICTDTPACLTVETECPTRRYTFRVDEQSEEKYLVRCTGKTNAGCRFNDDGAETVYKFTMKDTSGVKSIVWNAVVGGQLWLQFTTDDASKTSDGINWVDLYKYEAAEGDPIDKTPDLGAQSYDLTALLVNEDGSLKAETFYLRVADSVQPGGWGGNILTKNDQVLLVKADKVEAPDPEEEKKVSEFENAVLKYTVKVNAGGIFCFTTIAHPNYEIKEGDYLVYQVRMDAASRDGHIGSIDMNFDDDGKPLRDTGTRDTAGVAVHPTEKNAFARDNIWYTRTINLTAQAGRVIKDFQLSQHLPSAAAEAMELTAYYDNIIIYNASGVAKCIIYQDDTNVPTAEYVDGPANGTKSTVENVECMAYEHEYVVFTPLDDTDPGTEKPYLYETNAGNNGNCRFSDTTLHTIYKFDIENTLSVERVLFTALLGQQMKFSVSMDGKNWTTVYEWKDDAAKAASAGNGWKITTHTVDLTNGVDFSISKSIYIMLEDSYPEDGWGGSIYNDEDAMLDVWYVKLTDEELDAYEAKKTEHCVPLFGCNVEFGGWKLDKEVKTNGSSSLTKSVGKGSADQYKLETPVDATGMDTFEFDIWVSDLSFFDKFAAAGMNSGFEITSSGACDKQERSWNLADIKNKSEGDVLVANTWCHVILPLSTSAVNETDGALNLASVNFIRFFFVNETEDTGITLKIDNLKFTDYVAQKDKAAEEEAAPAIEKLNALKDAKFSDDNAKSLKSDITKARKAYDKLSDEAKAKVPAAVLKYLTDAEKARDEYEAAQDATPTPTEAPTGEPTDEPTGEPTAEPTEAPDDNNNSTLVIVIVAVVVVLAAAACLYFFVFKKKK